MLFNSYEYLFYFLPATLVVYFLLGRFPKVAQVWLLSTSLFFYGWWNPKDLPLIGFSIAANFYVGTRLRAHAVGRKYILILSVTFNLALLGIFKYAGFATGIFNQLSGATVPIPDIALPLGISFFTFTQIAYLVDVYRRKASEVNPVNYGLFVSFFPHLLAGPIFHHSEMMPQFASAANKKARADNIAVGVFLIAIGLSKKVLLADQFAIYADAGFQHPGNGSALCAWVAIIAYTLQIYFDFSGYTDMALGAARLFNIRMPINFNSPYRATSIQDFWHRWHITLSRFLRDYLYIPLGGNRCGPVRTSVNVLLTFVLGGLWHGASWTFVVWGLLHGTALTVQRLWRGTARPLPVPVAWMLTLLFVTASWVFFRAHDLTDAIAMLRSMAGLTEQPLPFEATWLHAVLVGRGPYEPSLLAMPPWSMVPIVFGLVIVFTRRNSNVMAEEFVPTLANAAATAAALGLSVLQLARVTPFLYFNF